MRHSNRPVYKIPAARRQSVSEQYPWIANFSLHGFRGDHDFEFEDDVLIDYDVTVTASSLPYLAVTAINNSATTRTNFLAQIVERLQTPNLQCDSASDNERLHFTEGKSTVCTHVLSRRTIIIFQ